MGQESEVSSTPARGATSGQPVTLAKCWARWSRGAGPEQSERGALPDVPSGPVALSLVAWLLACPAGCLT